MRKLLCYLTAVLLLSTASIGAMFGQLSGITHELYATEGAPGFNTYRIYAEMQDADDFLSALYGAGDDELVLGGSGNSIYNDGFGSTTGDALNTGFCMFVPTLCYDSYLTIGWAGANYWDDLTPIDCGQSVTVISSLPTASVIPDAFGVSSSTNLVMQDGSWFTPNLVGCNDNGFGFGPNNRVLIAQVSIPIADDLLYNFNAQIFDGGVGTNSLFYVGDCNTVNGDDVDGSQLGMHYPADSACGGDVEGCATSTACNYDSTVTVDNGSCTFPGCDDSSACNYDSLAGCDDGSCAFPGCDDSSACNYDSLAGCDDGSCTFPGCDDSSACNYDSLAGCDDGSCAFPGCDDSSACNYDSLAGCDDGSCAFPGCDDSSACNYDSL
ncbi:MAG: hypothetical protein ACI9RU_001283, partial [Litorivivens sp.]